MYIAGVLGRCGRADTVDVATWLVIHGIFFPVPWTPWEAAWLKPPPASARRDAADGG